MPVSEEGQINLIQPGREGCWYDFWIDKMEPEDMNVNVGGVEHCLAVST
jgi:hypothetical protein